jgi:hypothetical protein
MHGQQNIKFHRSSVGVVTIPQGRQPNNGGSIPGAATEFSLLKTLRPTIRDSWSPVQMAAGGKEVVVVKSK